MADYKPWSNPADIKTDGITVGDFMTCEDNFVILDGTKTEWPDDTSLYDWGWFSDSMSGADGYFASPPTIDITFTTNHKSPGLTLLFYPHNDDYASEVRSTWYNAAGAVITTGIYTLTSNVGVINESVDDFRRIKLEMLRTNIPYRYIKLYGIEYGISEVFADNIIETATLQEGVDPISDTLAVNMLRFSIKTHNAAFSLISGETADNMLMKRQKLDLIGDGAEWGTFFLDSWADNDGTEVHFSFIAQSAIGVMDGYKFYGGLYDGYPLKSLLDDIFAVVFPTGLVGYQLDAQLQGVTISGYLPILTCREALQYICFAIGAIPDTSRCKYVWIYKASPEIEYSIPLERIYVKTPVAPTDYYSGVDLTTYNYQQISDTVTAFSGIKAVGQHRIEFSQPLWGLAVTGATVISQHVNYVDISVTTQGTVTVTGKAYSDNAAVISLRNTVEAGEVEAIAEFAGVGLVNQSNGPALAQSLLNYLNHRIRITPEVRLEGEEVGMSGTIATHRKPIRGIIESLDINVRAQKARAVIVGDLEE